jgi:predicted HAD superfamily hydrolase
MKHAGCLNKSFNKIISSTTNKVVSFDIFDTAIGRIFAKPDDLFLLVESRVAQKTQQPKLFAALRSKAEAMARKRAVGHEDITLDEIYQCLTDMGFSHEECEIYKTEEILTELSCCYAIPNIKAIYQQAIAAGKPVIFVSDMYLPQQILEKMLQQCGYTSYAKIYVSNEMRVTKATGHLYDKIITELKTESWLDTSAQLLHIGDNLISDIQHAKQRGIQTLRVRCVIGRFSRQFKEWPLLQKIKSHNKPLQASLLAGIHAHYWLTERQGKNHALTWQDIGFLIAGPMLFGFARWLHEQCLQEGHHTLHFLSRDGYAFKKAFDLLAPILNSQTTSSYIYSSRRAMRFPLVRALNEDAANFFTDSHSPMPAREYLSRLDINVSAFQDDLRAMFGEENTLVPKRDERMRALFQRIFPRLQPEIEKERDLLLEYMQSNHLLSGKVAICDIGYSGSMQTAMAKLANPETTYFGYYLAAWDVESSQQSIMKSWLCDRQDNKPYLIRCLPLLELFFTAPHGTVIKFFRDESNMIQPVLKQTSLEDEAQFQIAADIQAGALQFVRSILNWHLIDAMSTEESMAIAGWDALTAYPTRRFLQLMSAVTHNDGVGTSSVKPILARFSLRQLLLHPMECARQIRYAYWPLGTQLALPWLGRYLYLPLLHCYSVTKIRLQNFIKELRCRWFGFVEWCRYPAQE